MCEVGYLNSGGGDCGEKEALGRLPAFFSARLANCCCCCCRHRRRRHATLRTLHQAAQARLTERGDSRGGTPLLRSCEQPPREKLLEANSNANTVYGMGRSTNGKISRLSKAPYLRVGINKIQNHFLPVLPGNGHFLRRREVESPFGRGFRRIR